MRARFQKAVNVNPGPIKDHCYNHMASISTNAPSCSSDTPARQLQLGTKQNYINRLPLPI